MTGRNSASDDQLTAAAGQLKGEAVTKDEQLAKRTQPGRNRGSHRRSD